MEDMVVVGSIQGTLFNLRLAEGESVKEHVWNLDYTLILANSLPWTWEAFWQMLQPDLPWGPATRRNPRRFAPTVIERGTLDRGRQPQRSVLHPRNVLFFPLPISH